MGEKVGEAVREESQKDRQRGRGGRGETSGGRRARKRRRARRKGGGERGVWLVLVSKQVQHTEGGGEEGRGRQG